MLGLAVPDFGCELQVCFTNLKTHPLSPMQLQSQVLFSYHILGEFGSVAWADRNRFAKSVSSWSGSVCVR